MKDIPANYFCPILGRTERHSKIILSKTRHEHDALHLGAEKSATKGHTVPSQIVQTVIRKETSSIVSVLGSATDRHEQQPQLDKERKYENKPRNVKQTQENPQRNHGSSTETASAGAGDQENELHTRSTSLRRKPQVFLVD